MSNVRPEHLNELQRSLEAVKELLPALPDKRMSSDATTASPCGPSAAPRMPASARAQPIGSNIAPANRCGDPASAATWTPMRAKDLEASRQTEDSRTSSS